MSSINQLVYESLLLEGWKRKAFIAGTAIALSPRIGREAAMGIARRADSQGNEDLSRRATAFANNAEKFDVTSSVGRQYMGQHLKSGYEFAKNKANYANTKTKESYNNMHNKYDNLPPQTKEFINKACKFGMTATCIAAVNEVSKRFENKYGTQAGQDIRTAANKFGFI